ncbi:Uu.00g147250.m01.CDS01 [Anthostomella pinea]|uniref:Mitochondrial transcription factor 1 n=1 Tax=Anthostomella pinea TaxID=933095 RepID=A0AAI8VS21_9PEZI|nr:Uu.00g147250.m01.CDS01 [Anthostomella pinea]
MFTVRSHVPAALLRLPVSKRLLSSTCHRPGPPHLEKAIVQSEGPVAEQLVATGLWKPTRGPGAKKTKEKTKDVQGDKTRVNIVSDGLCDDILSYVGSSLDRHKGCDIIDINPGAGVWSRKLHERLQPRSHILMEPDAELYRPFLEPILERPGATIVPKSGLVWRDLNSILTPEYLPHQVVPEPAEQMRQNDTLLVTANFSFHPKKRFHTFESMAQLLLHQFVDAVRTSNLFQRYGLVRMLVWTRSDDKGGVIPKSMQKRRRGALEFELLCEYVHEVCGRDVPESPWFIREDAIINDSNRTTLKRMRAAKMRMPAGREPESLKGALAASKSRVKGPVPGKSLPTFQRPFQATLSDLETAHDEDLFAKGSEDFKALQRYRWRSSSEDRKHQRMLELQTALDRVVALHKSSRATPKSIEAAEAEFLALCQGGQGMIGEFTTYKDNIHLWRQDPPLLNWDRRQYDPMVVRPAEFFPNIECSLLDIQPKVVHPLLRQTGPNSNRAADSFELITGSLMNQGTQPLGQTLDALWPGAADYILPRWKSGKDFARGGFLDHLKHAEPTARLLNAGQWEELLELWMEWPFRPEFHELVARTQEDWDKYDESGPVAN